jgi:hypothetical protein
LKRKFIALDKSKKSQMKKQIAAAIMAVQASLLLVSPSLAQQTPGDSARDPERGPSVTRFKKAADQTLEGTL